MGWDIGMSGEESKPKREILPEGDIPLLITDVNLISADESGSGNPYFIWELTDDKNNVVDIGGCKVVRDGEEIIFKGMITTLKKGQRWLLKQTLEACGIIAKENDPEERYSFEKEDVIGKRIVVTIRHKPNTFTGRDGNQVTLPKANVSGVKGIQILNTGTANVKGVQAPLNPGKLPESKAKKTIEDEEFPF